MQSGDAEAAMLHACNAVDGTARKAYPALLNKERFTRLLRENYGILGPMGAPETDLASTHFPVTARVLRTPDGSADIAEKICANHRCVHGHGDELPQGFELMSDAIGPPRRTQMILSDGRVHLSDRIVYGLVAVAVLSSLNATEQIPNNYFLSYGGNVTMVIHEWWGRAADFPSVVSTDPVPILRINFPSTKA
jgi:hypothetical protein